MKTVFVGKKIPGDISSVQDGEIGGQWHPEGVIITLFVKRPNHAEITDFYRGAGIFRILIFEQLMAFHFQTRYWDFEHCFLAPVEMTRPDAAAMFALYRQNWLTGRQQRQMARFIALLADLTGHIRAERIMTFRDNLAELFHAGVERHWDAFQGKSPKELLAAYQQLGRAYLQKDPDFLATQEAELRGVLRSGGR